MPLFSRTEGNKKAPALVFLHGFLGNADDWRETIAHLKDHYYCICLDLPGHSHSVPCSPPLQGGFAYCHQLIKSALDELQIKQYSFIGYSLGARIALDYARTQDDSNLQNLILESCHTGLTCPDAKEQRYQHDLNWAKRFAAQSIEESLYQWYEQAIFSDLSYQKRDFLINKRSHNYGVCLANMLLSTSLAQQNDALPFLQRNCQQKQALTIYYCYGEKDDKFKKIAHKLAAKTAIKITEFTGAGHNIHQHAPQQYAQFIMRNIPHIFNNKQEEKENV